MNGSARVVGDDEDLGRPGEQIDPDFPVQLPLGLRHVGVAGPGEDIDRVDGLGPDRHRRDGLHPAEQVDLVGTGQVHSGNRRGRHLAADRRGASSDPFDARHLCRHHGHVGGGDQRVATTGHVGTRRNDWEAALTQPDPRCRLDLEVAQRVTLVSGEHTDVLLHGPDVIEHLAGHRGDNVGDRVRAEPETVRTPAVERRGVLADGCVAARPDVVDHPGDRVAHHRIRCARAAICSALLHVHRHANHLVSPVSNVGCIRMRVNVTISPQRIK